MNEERIKKLVKELIVEIGEDPTREGLTKTPERVADTYKEITQQQTYSITLSILLRRQNRTYKICNMFLEELTQKTLI